MSGLSNLGYLINFNNLSNRLYQRFGYQSLAVSLTLFTTISAYALPAVTPIEPAVQPSALIKDEIAEPAAQMTPIDSTLAAQLKPSNAALSEANQKLLSQNAQLRRQVNDLQTQVNVLVYESKGQLFLYGAFTVLISLLVGIFISWLVFAQRARW